MPSSLGTPPHPTVSCARLLGKGGTLEVMAMVAMCFPHFPQTQHTQTPDTLYKANSSLLIRLTRIGMKMMSVGTYLFLVGE